MSSLGKRRAIRGAALSAARAAKRKALSRLRNVAAVNGIGLARRGTGYILKVNLSAPLTGASALPADIDGVPVMAEVVGAIHLQRRLP